MSNHFVRRRHGHSPFLRRPDVPARLALGLLAQPSLPEHLFSGLFIGPTSHAGGGGNHQLRELEIALGQIAKAQAQGGAALPPWLVDRALRNVLVDVTGTTRSQFCIDKLYSPDSATGRLGLGKCAPSRCRPMRA